MATGTIQKTTGTRTVEAVLETLTESSTVRGYVYGTKDDKLKIAWIRWWGNGSAPTAGLKTFTLPSGWAANGTFSAPLRYANEYIEISGSTLNVNLNNQSWSSGGLCYALA